VYLVPKVSFAVDKKMFPNLLTQLSISGCVIFKKKMNANIKMHRKEMSKKIKNLRSNNSKEYWNILRQGTNKKQPNISIDSLFEFFRNINKAAETNNEDEINLPDIDSNLINNLNDEINGVSQSNDLISLEELM
jgi:hypothetical protein